MMTLKERIKLHLHAIEGVRFEMMLGKVSNITAEEQIQLLERLEVLHQSLEQELKTFKKERKAA